METKLTTGRQPRLRRGKTMIATLVAISAMVGGAQAFTPTSAIAMRTACESYYNAAQHAYNMRDMGMYDYWMGRWLKCEEEMEMMESL
jgi:hypothetical protein